MPEHFLKGITYLEDVSTALARGAGTKKAEREELERKVNAALVSFRSAAFHEERLTRDVYDELETVGRRRQELR